MRQYPKYLAEGGYLTELVEDDDTEAAVEARTTNTDARLSTNDLRTQAGRVAKARGWKAILRVGGGVVWDEAYRSVSDWNAQQPEWTYHVVGGGAGTVSATGGWMTATGLSGTTGMRRFGFGVDQAAQLEMVLPTGQHVRFGPTGWQDDAGLAWPRTTEVTGWCNTNPDALEEEWVWKVCSDEEGINFMDLWHAVRGGGGGFGVILSVEYQLPDWPGETYGLGFNYVSENFTSAFADVCGTDCEEETAALHTLLGNFWLDALYDPSAVGLTEEESNLCGSPGSGSPLYGGFTCFGDAYPSWSKAFEANIDRNRDALLAGGFTDKALDVIKATFVQMGPAFSIGGSVKDYTQIQLSYGHQAGVPEGRIPDSPRPAATFSFVQMNLLVPINFINSEKGRNLFLADPQGLYTTGGNSATYHDGTAATSASYRKSGLYVNLLLPQNEALLKGLLSYHVGDGQEGNSFPPVGEFNHMTTYNMGPLKGDWSEACPLPSDSFSYADREEQCISKLEFVFGTEGLARLEAIKAAVDPQHLFNCYGCIGYRDGSSFEPELNDDEFVPSASAGSSAALGAILGPVLVIASQIL